MNYSDTQVYSENKMAPRQIQIEEDTLQFLSSTGWNLFSCECSASGGGLAGGELRRRLCVLIPNGKQRADAHNYNHMDATCNVVHRFFNSSTYCIVWVRATADRKSITLRTKGRDFSVMTYTFVSREQEIQTG